MTVCSAMHYIAQQDRKTAIVGWEWDALLFYLSLGFRPITSTEELIAEDENTLPWETAQIWAEIIQLVAQTNPSQLHLLGESALPQTASPPTAGADVWIDDFMVDEDGDLKVTRASIDDDARRVGFAGEALTAEGFLKTLQARPADPEKAVFLQMTEKEPGAFGRDVRCLLWSAGYPLSGLVGPR